MAWRLGDFTGTNRLDAAVAIQGGGVSFLTNTGGGDFSPLVNNPFSSDGSGTRAVATGNLLNSPNGQADIVAVNQTANTIGIFLGTSGGTPPGPPVLQFTITTNLQQPRRRGGCRFQQRQPARHRSCQPRLRYGHRFPEHQFRRDHHVRCGNRFQRG